MPIAEPHVDARVSSASSMSAAVTPSAAWWRGGVEVLEGQVTYDRKAVQQNGSIRDGASTFTSMKLMPTFSASTSFTKWAEMSAAHEGCEWYLQYICVSTEEEKSVRLLEG